MNGRKDFQKERIRSAKRDTDCVFLNNDRAELPLIIVTLNRYGGRPNDCLGREEVEGSFLEADTALGEKYRAKKIRPCI